MRITKVQISGVWCQELMKSAQNVLESQDSIGRNSFSSSTINHHVQVFKRQNLMCLFWRARLLRSWCLPASLILSLNPLPQIHDSPPILVCLSSSKEAFGLQPLHLCTGHPAWHGWLTFHLLHRQCLLTLLVCSLADLSVFPDMLWKKKKCSLYEANVCKLRVHTDSVAKWSRTRWCSREWWGLRWKGEPLLWLKGQPLPTVAMRKWAFGIAKTSIASKEERNLHSHLKSPVINCWHLKGFLLPRWH